MPIEITRPWTLTLLLVAVPVIVYFYMRSLSDFPLRQRVISAVLRSLIVLLIILAIGGLTWLRSTDEQFVVFVVDESLSIGKENQERIESFLADAKRNAGSNRTALMRFARRPGSFESNADWSIMPESAQDDGSDGSQKEPWQDARLIAQDDPRNGSDLSAAIESSIAYLPAGYVPHVVVLSDGNETQGDSLQTALRGSVPISTIPLTVRADPEVQVSDVRVPAEVREGEPFNVEVVIESNHDDKGLIEVFRGDYKVLSETKELKEGVNRFVFPQSVERERLAAFTVRVSGLQEDTLLDNNSDNGLVFMSGKPRVLIIESDPNLIRDLAYALEDQGILTEVRPPQGMPSSLADLQNYELLMVSNVPATDLTTQQMEVARTYVQELGGGFIMLGGEQSFGLGGYYKSALEEILPVRSDFEKEKEKPSLGMVLVIDKSGSMSGDKIEMAKSAARSAVELLGNRDKIGVLAFDGETYVISEMQDASFKDSISSDIAQLDAGGGTTMYPAMELSYELLLASNTKLKHVILLTDGVSQPGDFEGLAQLMTSSKITVSTVAIGSDSDVDLLESIARIGKGRHYLTDDPSMVPQIFAKETVTASKSAIDEQPFLPQVIRASHALADLDMNSAPFLLGFVITRPKPTSEVILATETGDPLLAWWRYGLGMTAAFTSDAKSRWAAEWLTWPGYGKFWTQVIRQCMRKNDAKGIAVALNQHDGRATISVDAVDTIGDFLNDSQIELAVIDPQLGRQSYSVEQVAPGNYQTSVPTSDRGAYHFEFNVKQDGESIYRQSRGLIVSYSDELRIQPTNEPLLRRIAESTGGRFNPSADDVFQTEGVAYRPQKLWPILLAIALVLFVFDVALRRIDFSVHWPFRTWESRHASNSRDSQAALVSRSA